MGSALLIKRMFYTKRKVKGKWRLKTLSDLDILDACGRAEAEVADAHADQDLQDYIKITSGVDTKPIMVYDC